jgi:hypothetical protein
MRRRSPSPNHTVSSYATTVFSVTGTFVGTITFQLSADGGTTWYSLSCYSVGGSDIVTTATAPGIFRANVQGLDLVRANITAYTSGSITVTARSTNAPGANRTVRLGSGTNAVGKLAANSGVDIGDVDITSVIPGTGATNLGKPIDTAAGATDTGVAILGIRDDALATLTPADGDWAPFRVDSQGGLWLGGDIHDAADTGNPTKIGAKAETSPKGITPVADGDRTNLYADSDGLLMVKLNTSFGDLVSERVTDTGGTSTAFTNFNAVASTRNYVTAITVYNSSATAGTVDFRDGAAGSVLWTMPIPAGGGSVIANAMPLFRTSANTALAYDVSGALSTVTISVSGFQSKV